ncbi:MAG: hypothetical protein OXC57_07120 [Rhodobacteraceae bacterium]|nr:hypothetical protein [Paracoccaceae bacterium]
MTMNVINAVAQFERGLLIERTQVGLVRARSRGEQLRRPATFSADKIKEFLARIDQGETISAIDRAMKTSRQTIMRVRNHGK